MDRYEQLLAACKSGDHTTVSRLFEAGLTADDARANGSWALRWACCNGHLAVVDRLFEAGLTADDARAGDNWALRWACRNGHLAIVSRLFEAGLTAEDARADDNFALRWACAYGHLGVVTRLFEAGLTAEDARAQDNGALRSACARRRHEIIAVLLIHGAAPTGTALDLATQLEDSERLGQVAQAVQAHWAGTPELEAAEAGLKAAAAAEWEAAAVHPGLRFSD